MDDSPFPAWLLYSHSKLNYHVSYLPPLLCMSASKTSTFNCLLVVSVEVPQKAASERLQQQLSISASLLTSPGIQAGFLGLSYLQVAPQRMLCLSEKLTSTEQ